MKTKRLSKSDAKAIVCANLLLDGHILNFGGNKRMIQKTMKEVKTLIKRRCR